MSARLGWGAPTMILVLGLGACGVAACSDDDTTPATPKADAGAPDAPAAETGPTPGGDAGADAGDPNDGFTDAEIAAMKKLSPLPALPPDPTNKYADDAKAAELGQKLYFDKSISGDIAIAGDATNGGLGAVGETGKVSCNSCHAGPGGDDQRSKPGNVSLGIDFGTRNALPLANASYYAWTNWGGRFDSQWSLPPAVAENPKTMKSSRLQIAHLMWNKYRAEYDAIFPVKLDAALDPAAADAARFPAAGKPKANAADPDGAWELMDAADRTIVNAIFAGYGKAIQAYMRKLVSKDAPFDKYVAGDRAALSAEAKAGFKLFVGKGACVQCHAGPHFSDDRFHAIGVQQTGPNVPAADNGRFQDVPALLASAFNTSGAFSDDTTTGRLAGLAQIDAQKGQFRTPSLRNVAQTAPYFHAGQAADLTAAVSYYGTIKPGSGLDPLLPSVALTAEETSALVAFLKTLTGAPVPAPLLVDTSKP